MSVFFATARGKVRRNELADFIFVPSNGKIAMGLDEGDRLVGAEVCDDSHDIVLAAAGRPGDPLPGRRRARVQVAQLGGRATAWISRPATR